MIFRRTSEAFSLVEVVLSLGVAAFALISIFGLLSVAATSGKEASDDTLVANMSNDLIATWRGMPFGQIPSADAPAGTDVASGATPAPVTWEIYFDENGKRLVDATGEPMDMAAARTAGAIYKCVVRARGDSQTLSAKGTNSQVNLLKLELAFQWPAMAASPRNQKVIHATIARF